MHDTTTNRPIPTNAYADTPSTWDEAGAAMCGGRLIDTNDREVAFDEIREIAAEWEAGLLEWDDEAGCPVPVAPSPTPEPEPALAQVVALHKAYIESGDKSTVAWVTLVAAVDQVRKAVA